jgi:hypothetical protein
VNHIRNSAEHIEQLAQDLRSATEPSRALDNRLWLLFGSKQADPDAPFRGERLVGGIDPREVICGRDMKTSMELFPDDVSGINRSWNVPDVTANVHEALKLVPEGTSYSVGGGGDVEPWAQLHTNEPVQAANIAMAVCAAHCDMVAAAFRSIDAYTEATQDD